MLIGDEKEGRLNMIEFDSMNKALKASWVRRLNNDAIIFYGKLFQIARRSSVEC